VDTTLQQARRMGAPRAIALCQNFNGALEYQIGRWTEAEVALREAIQLFRQINAADGEALSCQRLGILQTNQGQLEEGLTTLEDGIIAAKHAKLRAHIQGRLYAAIARNRLLADDLSAADHALSLGQTMVESHGHCPLCESLLLPVAVSIRIAQNDLLAAEEFCRQLEEATARYGSLTWLALAAQARAELAAVQGDTAAAIAHYSQAQAKFSEAKNETAARQCAAALAQLQA
jgi:predicted negative regulator of RcsB-dependent stress response